MRLFIAVNFDDKIKDSLCKSVCELKARGIAGNFSSRENMHLTVVFIGETTRVSDVKSALNKLNTEPFSLEIGGLGSFHGNILWCRIKENSGLYDIYSQLNISLKQYGFKTEDRSFSPHLTVCREALLPSGLDLRSLSPLFPALKAEIRKISLMKSERINGKLIYTEIYAKELQNG
jgi:2'-5' RNA ligase